jgi:prepilin-type N-terminal cleavage/methylation domain-containing protein
MSVTCQINRPVFLRRSAAPGFTLVELLVVMAIIGMLVAILLPALSKAKASVLTTRCLNTLRNMGVGSQAFSIDHKQHMSITGDAWPVGLQHYVGTSTSTGLAPSARKPFWWCQANPLSTSNNTGVTNKASSYAQNPIVGGLNSGATLYIRWTGNPNPIYRDKVPVTITGTTQNLSFLRYDDRYRGNPVGWTCAGEWKVATNQGFLGSVYAANVDMGGSVGTGPDHATRPNVGPGYWHGKATTALHLQGNASTYSYQTATEMSADTQVGFLEVYRY